MNNSVIASPTVTIKGGGAIAASGVIDGHLLALPGSFVKTKFDSQKVLVSKYTLT